MVNNAVHLRLEQGKMTGNKKITPMLWEEGLLMKEKKTGRGRIGTNNN